MNTLYLTDSELDQPIYRIMKPEHLYAWFKTGENVLVRPKRWLDPFENFILQSPAVLNGEIIRWDFADKFVGQCWTLHKASDAMWQIYSNANEGIRVRTTIRKALEGLTSYAGEKAHYQAHIGKVRYLPDRKLRAFANSAISIPLTPADFAKTLLVKRPAFKHEREIRLLFFADPEDLIGNDGLFRYRVNPHEMIDQLMVDGRLPVAKARELIDTIRVNTGYCGPIKRSLLYTLPKGFQFTVKSA
jgi:hypothetical protein